MMSKETKQELVDHISRCAAILSFEGETLDGTYQDVKRLNLKYAGKEDDNVFDFAVSLMKAQARSFG